MRLIFLVFLFSLRSFSQATEKPGYVLNENGENISQEIFLQQTRAGKYTWVTYETKDSLNVRLILREEYGKISPQKKQHLLNNLKEITGTAINEKQTIIINFAFIKDTPNQRHCLDYYSSVKSYRNFFKNKEQFAQFYISQQGFNYTKEFVFEDKDDQIRKMIFPFGSNCNYIIIKPDGRFYRQMSEHHQDKIPKKAKADW
jgi:hypothetical protein